MKILAEQAGLSMAQLAHQHTASDAEGAQPMQQGSADAGCSGIAALLAVAGAEAADTGSAAALAGSEAAAAVGATAGVTGRITASCTGGGLRNSTATTRGCRCRSMRCCAWGAIAVAGCSVG